MQESKKLFSFAMKGSDERKFVLDNFKHKKCGGVKIKDFFRKVFFPKNIDEGSLAVERLLESRRSCDKAATEAEIA